MTDKVWFVLLVVWAVVVTAGIISEFKSLVVAVVAVLGLILLSILAWCMEG